MSEEELYAGLSAASELVQRGILSRNRRAIIKELVLRWDGQVMEAIRKYGSSDELGQELGSAAEREIKAVIMDAFLEMRTAAGIKANNNNNRQLLSFTSIALALQNINMQNKGDITCFCLESGMGELSIAVSMLEDFSKVHGIISSTSNNSNIITPQDVVDRFDITFRPMLDMSLSNTFEFKLEANDWRTYKIEEWSNADILIISLDNERDFDDFKKLSAVIKEDSFLIVIVSQNNSNSNNSKKMPEDQFDLLYTWETDDNEGDDDSSDNSKGTAAYVYQCFGNSANANTYTDRYTSALKSNNTKNSIIPKTPPRDGFGNNRKNGSQYYNSDIDYSSSPIGSSLMARKHTFMADGDNKDVMQDEMGDKSTPSFDESISSPIGERLMLRKRIHSNSNLGKKSWSTSSGTNIPQQGINKPRRGWSEDSSDSDSNNSNKDKRPFNVKNTSSPIGSRLLQRKMQFSTRAPLPSSSLSSSSSISDDDNYNNVIKNPYNDSKRGVNYEFNLNQTPPKSALSPLQRRLFMQGLNKKSNSGNDNSINNEEAPSSPMGDALLLRRRKVNPNNANNGNDNGLNFDVSSPKSSRLLQRKHQLAQGKGSNVNIGKNVGIDFSVDSVSSPKSTRLLARKHMISSGIKRQEAWGEGEK